jgi:hypothetical protein
MIQLPRGEWHCPSHALLAAGRELVALHNVQRDADWAALSKIIGETLPAILDRFPA